LPFLVVGPTSPIKENCFAMVNSVSYKFPAREIIQASNSSEYYNKIIKIKVKNLKKKISLFLLNEMVLQLIINNHN
jgi:hypothetical protein